MNWDKLQEAISYIQSQTEVKPVLGIVLGTGLGNLISEIEIEKEIEYEHIPNFPLSTVEFHTGKLIFGTLGNKLVVAMQGRMHPYEGYRMQEVVFPIQVLKLLGIKHLLISNAAGAINLDFKKGDLMIIIDHIDLFPQHPLTGNNDNRLGTRFPDMSEAYDLRIREIMKSEAKALDLNIREGIYISAQGPMLETPAEYRMLRNLGGDAVGMSTIPEVIAANHMGLPCAAVSVLTDECDPDNLQPVNIEDIIAVAGKTEKKLTALFVKVIEKM
ncbi:MAG: purine-nucleoside phosphorylase [Flavobacteriales bacterium]|jgi:purine-nucleoside phosphorylase